MPKRRKVKRSSKTGAAEAAPTAAAPPTPKALDESAPQREPEAPPRPAVPGPLGMRAYPVATVVVGGLITSTLFEFLLRPALFWVAGRKEAARLIGHAK